MTDTSITSARVRKGAYYDSVTLMTVGRALASMEGIVDAALKRVEAGLTQKLPELMAVLLHEQALAISERLRREIRSTVRESVQASLAQAIPELRHVPTSGAGIRSAAPHVSGTT